MYQIEGKKGWCEGCIGFPLFCMMVVVANQVCQAAVEGVYLSSRASDSRLLLFTEVEPRLALSA